MVFCWFLIWAFLSYLIQSDLLLPSPIKVLSSTVQLFPQSIFWDSCLNSLIKIWEGCLLGILLGVCLGYIASKKKLINEFFAPLIRAMTSVPIASFALLGLIWLGKENLSSLTAFLVSFPILYSNILEGMSSIDSNLLEVAEVYRFNYLKRWRYIELDALFPFLMTGSKVAIGMSWKAGIAAEVIGVPSKTIGEQFYMNKIYLDTAGLLSWTLVVIVLSGLSEKLFVLALKWWQNNGN